MIRKTVLLACDPQKAFRLFTQHASEWWPESRRHTGDPASEIRMLESGPFFERARDGREVELGRVRAWTPPLELRLDFFIGTDVDHPTEVIVRFSSEGAGTRVTIEHMPTPLSAELWKQRAGAFESSWAAVFSALEAAARRADLYVR